MRAIPQSVALPPSSAELGLRRIYPTVGIDYVMVAKGENKLFIFGEQRNQFRQQIRFPFVVIT
jgi:hypothetical protein